ncbi:MAG: type II toxin-antitoxin system HipA family toxin [Kiritimatiellia bacterium]|nr:type II toxin-antitoxin system HipA family toxin [Kiritimatiellia bacterium]
MSDTIVKSLDVRWNGKLVGSYDKFSSGSEQFTYDPTYLADSQSGPISLSLPLKAEPYSGPKLRPFFAGLLPEESQRSRIATYLGIAETDDFAFLETLGGECAGALTILPHGTEPCPTENGFTPLSDSDLLSIIETLPLRPLLAGDRELRLSLAGAQSKIPMIVRDGRIGLPVGNAPSTHILKPELSEWVRGIAANEHCCMTLARHLGLSVPETQLLQIGRHPCVLISRYDRDVDPVTGLVTRIHQEDFCQALGYVPERKYQTDGGPLIRDVVKLLRSGWSTAPARDVLSFVDLLIYNAIIGNADAHGKNYSMLYRGASRQLAPGYDLVSTVFWPALSRCPAMKIGGTDSVDSICHGHWKKLALELNLGFAQLLRRIRELCDQTVSTTLESLSLPGECRAVLDLVHSRARKLKASLN